MSYFEVLLSIVHDIFYTMYNCNFFRIFNRFFMSLSVVCCVSKGGLIMKEVNGFNITDKEFKLLSKKAEAITLSIFF